MGSSKTAQALMQKFNLEEAGQKVEVFKPYVDTRDGLNTIKSRIGIQSKCKTIYEQHSFIQWYANYGYNKVIVIIDECQFLTVKQIEQLKEISNHIDVYCYGLKTDFQTHLFKASKRLLEIADNIKEIESVCKWCGEKASVNARIDNEENIIYDGNQVEIGGSESYIQLCYECWQRDKD